MVSLTLFTLLALSCLSSLTQAAVHISPHHARAPAPVPDASPATHFRQRRSCATKRQHNFTESAHTTPSKVKSTKATTGGSANCFPALGFTPPANVPDSLDGWWCDASTEYAFLGFSYEVSACQSKSQLNKEFADIRNRFQGRYIRLYGACDQDGFYDDVVEAAYQNGLGIHALVWFGFDGGSEWKKRRDALFSTLWSNPKAKFVTRAIQFGSEPLLDGVLSASALSGQVQSAQNTLASLGIDVTVSDMAWSFTKDGGAGLKVLDTVDVIDAHILPFFDQHASTAAAAWPSIKSSIDSFWIPQANGRKIMFSQAGWPSAIMNGNQQPNSDRAVASVQQEKAFFDTLDANCAYFKSVPAGLGWFAHIYSDAQEGGYGILTTAGKPKFAFSPKTHC